MPKISALIHAENDALRIGRALESLRPCDEVIVVDHGSTDETERVARDYGATVVRAVAGVNDGAYAMDARHDWILCLLPNEALSEPLEASLFEWKESDPGEAAGFSFAVREETENGWSARGQQMRLVNRNRINWTDRLPPSDGPAQPLAGELLRFSKP